MAGHLAIGHTRYSTTGSQRLRNAQPHVIETMDGPLAIAHNGNLINAPQLRRELLERGTGLSSSSDTEIMLHLLAAAGGVGVDWPTRIRVLMARCEGAYTLTILTRDAVYGVRDPWGLRPLALGELEGGGYALASESCAFATIGARLVQEIGAGRDRPARPPTATRSSRPPRPGPRPSARSSRSTSPGPTRCWPGPRCTRPVRPWAASWPGKRRLPDADVVIAVPDSGTPHAIGFAQEAGLPFSEGLIKSRYIGRTFIEPTEALRQARVAMKFNPLPANLAGKRVVLVDDSIVRGNTSGPLLALLREAGAAEVHVRVACPPIRHPCFMGVDMASRDELIAATHSVEEIREHIKADSLAYLSLEGMTAALVEAGAGNVGGDRSGTEGQGYCNACFTGRYPFESVPIELGRKDAFDGVLDG